ncbi:MAG: hypothetical protein AAGE76_00505 [Pseudomonadota bacterium]
MSGRWPLKKPGETKMRLQALAVAALAALAACDIQPVSVADGPAAFTPVIWKTDTPAAARRQDRLACNLSAIGASPFATPEEIAALDARVDPGAKTSFVNRCMANKGYTLAEGRVCSAGDRARGQLVFGANLDSLPPLDSVRCFDPAAGGFILA